MTTRLYLDFTPSDKTIVLPAEECHYLLRVLRLKAGDVIHVYNEWAGECQANIGNTTKSTCEVVLSLKIREPFVEPLTRLVFAPLKHDAMAFLFEKATELGVTHLQPMVTDFAQKYNLHHDKIVRQLKQASQQSERLSVPIMCPPMRFEDVLDACGNSSFGNAYIALERAAVPSFTKALAQDNISACTFIVGPEGGFSVREIDLVKRSQVQHVSLGSTVLRAETAAIVGMGVISMWRSEISTS